LNKLFTFLIASLFLVSFGNYASAQYDDKLAILETNLGTIVIEFFPEDAPNHIDNFIGLSESGFYDGTLFHRIIPGFMIQGGDPNTISGDPNTWGTGGPNTSVDAEFNTIKHSRGIVSMARSADPNSAGSQFFVVHQDSNFLDEQYTVFGRIVTQESIETLDKIAAVDTGDRDNPLDPEQVKITKITIMDRSEVSNLLELQDPERTQSTIPSSLPGNQKFESPEHEIKFSVPEGWLLQEPEKTEENAPDVVAVGPKTGVMNPVISLTIQETNQRTFDELISQKLATIKPVIESGVLDVISQEKTTVNGYDAYVTNAQGFFSTNGEKFNVKFNEIMIYSTEKYYTLAYSNGLDNFDSHLSKFQETIDSFEIISQDTAGDDSVKETSIDETPAEGGGCLIATATFGSELAPQVQQLRELRDNTILSTESGTAFMSVFNQFYYSFSPVIADYERENPVFREMVKLSITPMLSTLSLMEHADSEFEVLSIGVSLIILNGLMYVGIPAIVIVGVRKF
jgi:peptidyl-prolyl cis-trans isomerase B (cyclophilin B)